MFDYLSIALKDLRGQPVRSCLTIFALIISTVILVIMAAITIGGKQAISDQFGSGSSLLNITVTPNQSGGSLSPYGSVQQVNTTANKLDDTTVDKISKLDHAQSASPRSQIWEFNSFSLVDSDKSYVANGEGVAVDAKLDIKSGSAFVSNDDTNAIVLGYSYAKALGYGDTPDKLIGKTINIVTQKGYRGVDAAIPGATASDQTINIFNQSTTTLKAKIIGVTNIGPDQNNILTSIGWAHSIRTARYSDAMGIKSVDQIVKDGYASIQVRVDSKTNVDTLSSEVNAMGYGVVSTLSQIQQLQQFSALMWIILGAISLIAIIASALGVVNTMLMTVSEQRYSIGVWRALGARKRFIVRLFLVEAAILGFTGGIIGVGVGVLLSSLVNQYVNVLLKSQGLAIVNIAVIPLWLMLSTIALTTIFGIVAGLYPAYRAARQDPSQALSSGQ